MRLSHLSIAVGTALLAGCMSMAPGYQRPAQASDTAWPTGPAYAAPQDGPVASQLAWRDFIADAPLRKLIELALANNRDLRVAALNIEKTEAQFQIQRAALFPAIKAAGGESASRTPGSLEPTGQSVVGRAYTANVGVTSYELDFFGRVRSLKDQALETYLATEEAHRSATAALVAQVATAYFTLAADREHLAMAKGTFDAQDAAYKLSQRRFDLGAASQLDLSQAQTAVETARSDVARYIGLVAQDQNALALLVGAPIAPDMMPAASLTDLALLKPVAPGLPSDLMQNRPDVLAAEHQLKAANANIGAARAAFFPTISLTSTVGTASNELSGLFKSGSRAWSFVPQISLPIFDAGANIAGLKVSKVNRDIALAQYDKTVQTAFREVADALAVAGTADEQVAAQRALVKATSETHRLADARFQRGVDSYLVVLDAQRSQYAAQQNLITAQLAQLANLVSLYKALGGGTQA